MSNSILLARNHTSMFGFGWWLSMSKSLDTSALQKIWFNFQHWVCNAVKRQLKGLMLMRPIIQPRWSQIKRRSQEHVFLIICFVDWHVLIEAHTVLYLTVMLRYVCEKLGYRTATPSHFHIIDPNRYPNVGGAFGFPRIQQIHHVLIVISGALRSSLSLQQIKTSVKISLSLHYNQ